MVQQSQDGFSGKQIVPEVPMETKIVGMRAASIRSPGTVPRSLRVLGDPNIHPPTLQRRKRTLMSSTSRRGHYQARWNGKMAFFLLLNFYTYPTPMHICIFRACQQLERDDDNRNLRAPSLSSPLRSQSKSNDAKVTLHSNSHHTLNSEGEINLDKIYFTHHGDIT